MPDQEQLKEAPAPETTQAEPSKQLSAVEERLQALQKGFEKEKEAARLDQLEGKLNELREETGKALQDFDSRMSRVVDGVNNQATTLMQQIMALEQAILSFGKILTAAVTVLREKGLVVDDDMMNQLRIGEDKREEEELNQMVNLGLLELTQKIDDQSIVVFRQEEIAGDTQKLVSDFRRVEIVSMKADDPLRKEFLGKAAGDVIALLSDGKSFTFTVKAVYKLAEKGKLEAPPSKE